MTDQIQQMPSMNSTVELDKAEAEFIENFASGAEKIVRAYLILDVIRETEAWKDSGASTWNDYISSLREKIEREYPNLPTSMSQIQQKLRFIRRAKALGMPPEQLVSYPHPSVLNRIWRLGEWNSKTGDLKGLSEKAKSLLEDRYETELVLDQGDNSDERVVRLLIQDTLDLPSASEAHKSLNDFFNQKSRTVITYRWVITDFEVQDVQAVVEERDEEGAVVDIRKYSVFWEAIPPEVLHDLSRRFNIPTGGES